MRLNLNFRLVLTAHADDYGPALDMNVMAQKHSAHSPLAGFSLGCGQWTIELESSTSEQYTVSLMTLDFMLQWRLAQAA